MSTILAGAEDPIEKVIDSDSSGMLHLLAAGLYFASTNNMQEAATAVVHAGRFSFSPPPAYMPVVFSKCFEKKGFYLLAETVLRHAVTTYRFMPDSLASGRSTIYGRIGEHYEQRKNYATSISYFKLAGRTVDVHA